MYVVDLIELIHLIISNQDTKYELLNAGLGKSISIAGLVEKIIIASGKKLKINYDKSKPTIKTKITLDVNKAKNIFNWEPKTSLVQGINQTLEWYRRNK